MGRSEQWWLENRSIGQFVGICYTPVFDFFTFSPLGDTFMATSPAQIRKPYTFDLTEAQWAIIKPFIPVHTGGDRAPPTCVKSSMPFFI